MDNKIKFNDFQKEVGSRGDLYKNAVNRVIDSGWYILGKEVDQFETEFKTFLHAEHCIGVANGLEALQIALMALGVGQGDEVITTPLSAIATTLSIMAVGATPVYCDVDDRGQMNVEFVEGLITPKTKAIMPVHLYGLSCDPEVIAKICTKHKIHYIEDACQAHGSKFKNKYLGTFSKISAFSFYPTKNLGGIGDGGAIVTNDYELAQKCRCLRDYGQSEKYVHTEYGLNSRLDEIQAAILREKLNFLSEDNKKRATLAKIYEDKLSDVFGVELMTVREEESPNYHLFVIKTRKRDELHNFLKQQGIPTLIHYPKPLPDQPLFGNRYQEAQLPKVRELSNQILSLPIHPFLSPNDLEEVCHKVIEFCNKNFGV